MIKTSNSQPTAQKKPNQPKIEPETQITESSESSATPSHKARCDSLKNLPQFDDEQFGRGKRLHAPTSRAKAVVADAKEPVDANNVTDVEETLHRNGKSLDQVGNSAGL